MSSLTKSFLQYTLIIIVTVGLIWFSLRGLQVGEGGNKLDYLLNTWHSANKGWLLIMAAASVLSHLTRAERWRMLLLPAGQYTRFTHSFLSLMVGYLVNLVIPRGGEVSRCYNLYKLDKLPVDVTFGTVVVERIVDVLCLLLLIAFSFVLESQKLFAFINTLAEKMEGGSSKFTFFLYAIGGITLLGVVSLWLIKRNNKLNAILIKAWIGFKGGLLSVFRIKDKGLFAFYSFLIWGFYFVMSYAVIKAFPATNELGFQAVISLFAIGAIAMAAPLPGGTGSYHVLVPQGLVFLYGIPQPDAVAFTFIFHGWQTSILIIGGALSLIITSVIVKQRARKS